MLVCHLVSKVPHLHVLHVLLHHISLGHVVIENFGISCPEINF